jgi:hypothetical protein
MTTTYSDIALPHGARCYDTWQDSEGRRTRKPQPFCALRYRIVQSPERGIEGHELKVYAMAVQYADGVSTRATNRRPCMSRGFIGRTAHACKGSSASRAAHRACRAG